jgi:RND family efflux transporter MFP subunit
MTNRVKYLGVGIAVLILILAILFYNKAQMAAKAKNDVMTAVPVSTTIVKKQQLHDTRSFVGVIAANNDVPIISETQGKVTAVLSEVGRFVQAGAGLIQVDDELKKAALAAAEVNFEKARNDLGRFESLQKDSAVTAQQMEGVRLAFKSAEAQYIVARREHNDTKISSPIAGIVSARMVDVGSYVQRGTPVANVVDISVMKVKIGVPEEDVFHLKTGDVALVTSDVYPGAVIKGTIRTVSAKADEAHSYPVEVTLPNTKEFPLKAGMFGRISFEALHGGEAILIPRVALIGSTKNPQVFVVQSGQAQLRTLTIGSEAGSAVEVRSGLAEGETIIINGQNNVKAGGMVTIAHEE